MSRAFNEGMVEINKLGFLNFKDSKFIEKGSKY